MKRTSRNDYSIVGLQRKWKHFERNQPTNGNICIQHTIQTFIKYIVT